MLARIGVPVHESRSTLFSIDARTLSRTRWRWFEIRRSKRNWIHCTCHGGSAHRHQQALRQDVGTACDHVKALYEGRVALDKQHASALRNIYRVIFTERGEELFHWRLAALALLKE